LHDRQKIVTVDAELPETEIIRRAGKIILNSGVVIFPAQCLYGVAADALNETAVQKVFHLKKRDLNNPLLVLIHDQSQLKELVQEIPSSAEILMDTFWPGNLTIVFKAKKSIPGLLTAGTSKIGIRIPAHPVARAVVEYVRIPVTGTSANLSGERSCSRTDQMHPSIIANADLVLDAGRLKGGTGSTIVDVTRHSEINIIREGAIPEILINKALNR